MALTITSQKESQVGGLKLRILTVDFDASYPTGGEPLSADSLGVDPIYVMAEPSAGFVFTYNHTTNALLAYQYDYDAIADGAAIEVANLTNLSAVTGVRVLALGL